MSNDNTVLASRNQPTDVINFKIKLNGEVISGECKVASLYVEKTFNKISSAKVTISDGDPAKQDFAISSTVNNLTPGNAIEIEIGYHSQAKLIFKGLIVKHTIKSGKNKKSFLTIEAKDKAIKLALGRKSHCYIDKSDKDIIEEIAKRSGITGGDIVVPDLGVKHKQMVQCNAFDWDFIVSRAEMNGMVVLTDNNKLLVKKPDTDQQVVREITYGVDVVEFESEIDALTQTKKVTTHSWNFKDQKVEDSPEANIQFKENGNLKAEKLAEALSMTEENLIHAGSLTSEELKLWGDARLLKSRLSKAVGRIKVKGTTEIAAGQVIKLKGFSSRFNGNVIVTGVKQSYDEASWETDLFFGLKELWFYKREDVVEKPASGMIPGVNGLQIGVVIQLEDDPENEDRIKIQLPLIDKREGVWARIASLDAGKDRGSFFRPEVQDEVIVGFLNDDPRFPVILGMLNSSAKPAAIKAKDTNHEKGFVTRSKMKLIFNDDKKMLTIETPKGKKIDVNDDSDSIVLSDQNNNKITMDSSGISIESVKNISFKSSGGDVKIEGLNIENKAKVKFTAEANATASLQASGPTTIKGAVVNIN